MNDTTAPRHSNVCPSRARAGYLMSRKPCILRCGVCVVLSPASSQSSSATWPIDPPAVKPARCIDALSLTETEGLLARQAAVKHCNIEAEGPGQRLSSLYPMMCDQPAPNTPCAQDYVTWPGVGSLASSRSNVCDPLPQTSGTLSWIYGIGAGRVMNTPHRKRVGCPREPPQRYAGGLNSFSGRYTRCSPRSRA